MYVWVGGVESIKGFTVYGILDVCLLTALCVFHVFVCLLCVTGSLLPTDVLKVGQQIYWYLLICFICNNPSAEY